MDAEPSRSSRLMHRPALSPGEAQPPSWGQVCVLYIVDKVAGSKQPAVTLGNGAVGGGQGGVPAAQVGEAGGVPAQVREGRSVSPSPRERAGSWRPGRPC